MNWRIEPLPAEGPVYKGAVEVYSRAFAEPPYSDPDRGNEIASRVKSVHRGRAGFQAFAAVADDGRVAGMIYGYHGEPGQWWHDAVVRAVDRDAASKWFGDAYELVEVAVDPAFQSLGIGADLVNALLCDRPEATCVLSTRTDSRAHFLYRRLGFEVIKEMRFTLGGAPFYVMGRRLPYEA